MTPSLRPLLRSALRRLAGAALVLWAAATLTFLGIRAMPGSVEAVVLGVHLNDPGLRDQVRAALGLDQPVLVQYLRYLDGLLRGDLGRSYVLRTDVGDLLGSQLGPTLLLALTALLLAATYAWGVAVTTAGSTGPVVRVLHAVELLAICLPTFWVGSLLLLAFSFQLRWFPSSGATGISSLVLPALTLALPVAGVLSQFMREEVARQLDHPHVLTAQARGIGTLRVRAVHLVPHAAVATLTLAGNMLGILVGGAVIVEAVFSRPGLGRLALNAVTAQDTPVITAIVLVITAAYVLISTALDLLALAIDPRLRKATA